MTTINFSLGRLGLLFRRYFIERFHSEAIYWTIVLLAFLFLHHFDIGLYLFIFVAGAFYAARFFRDIHRPATGAVSILLPATQGEKITFAILITTFYYLAMILLTYTLGNLLGTFLHNTLARIPFIADGYLELDEIFYPISCQWTLFDSFTSPSFNAFLRIFIFFQSIFLLGGLYFKTNQTLKTLFVGTLTVALLFILFILEIRLFIGPEDTLVRIKWDSTVEIENTLKQTIKWAITFLSPFFWAVTYVRLTEKEV
jgi:hypothetical protein